VYIVWERRAKAVRIISTSSSEPDTAASAARCETFATFDVAWLWKLVDALMMSSGPIIQPTRQPVIAYVLATPLTMMHWFASSGTTVGIDTNRWSP
jgi:hypothetical protein